MYSPLPKIEMIFYLLLCVFVMWYFLLHVYISGNFFVKYLGSDVSIVPGWSVLSRSRDSSDEELMSWSIYMAQVLPWLISHLLLSKICRYFYTRTVSFSHIFITLLFITFYIDISVSLLFLGYTGVFYLCSLTKSKIMIWVTGIALVVCNSYDVFNIRDSLDFHQSLLTEISFAWFVLKSIDFALSRLDSLNHCETLLDFIAYAFYLPTFFFGPFIPYDNFHDGIHQSSSTWTMINFKRFVKDFLRYSFWALIIEVSSHYFYCNALHYHLGSVIFRNVWTLNGIGFCLAQFFYLKYLVIYGMAGCIAKLEGYDSPPPPKCVNRIHLYSKMWRYFDRGYYLFTLNRIYIPVCKTPSCSRSRKFLGSVLSFCFVLLWHGLTYTVFYWSLFNFLGITLEALAKHLSSTSLNKHFVKLCRTPQNVRRFSCLLASPLWVLAVLSNYFFFGGHEYGFKCFQQFFDGDWTLILFTFLVAYAMCQISVEVENFEFTKQRKCHSETKTTKLD